MDRFIQGYACALSCIIVGHGVDTGVREAFDAGLKNMKECKKAGVDEYDLEILRKHFD